METKSCHLVPKVVIDLPFEESQKCSRRERVSKNSFAKIIVIYINYILFNFNFSFSLLGC